MIITVVLQVSVKIDIVIIEDNIRLPMVIGILSGALYLIF
jgi:hypothetical protein